MSTTNNTSVNINQNVKFEDLNQEQIDQIKGEDGRSAYQVWQDSGGVGSEADFINSLRGIDGKNGMSAYEVWKTLGNNGTSQDFINELKGETDTRKVIPSGFDFTNIPAGYDNAIWVISTEHDLSTNTLTIPANVTLQFNGGRFSNGSVVGNKTLINADLIQIFDTNVVFSGTWLVSTVYPQWWGAIADGAYDCTAAMDKMSAFANLRGDTNMRFTSGTYLYSGTWKPITAKNGYVIEGDSNSKTIIKFASYTSGSPLCIEFGNAFANLIVKNIRIQGAGKTVLNNGSPQTLIGDTAGTYSYGTLFENVYLSDVSGDAVNINLWFQQRWIGTFARRCGGNGLVIDGDQSPYFSTGGSSWFEDCDEYAIWIKNGYPRLEGVNVGPCSNGVKFGSVNPIRYAKASITGLNLEWIRNGGTGILFEAGSKCVQADNILIYSSDDNTPISTETVFAGIYFKNLNGLNKISELGFTRLTTSPRRCAGFEHLIYIENSSADAKLVLDRSRSDILDMNENIPEGIPLVSGENNLHIKKAVGVSGNIFFDDALVSKGLTLEGLNEFTPIVHTRSVDGTQINYGATVPLDSSFFAINPDDGSVIFNLPPAAFVSNKTIRIVKLKTPGNSISVNTYGTETINGA